MSAKPNCSQCFIVRKCNLCDDVEPVIARWAVDLGVAAVKPILEGVMWDMPLSSEAIQIDAATLVNTSKRELNSI
jgi:hypothetical protein